MIRITIDKSAATPEELAALEALPQVQAVIETVAAVGRGHGIALTVVEPVDADVYQMLRTMYPADQITPEMVKAVLPRTPAVA